MCGGPIEQPTGPLNRRSSRRRLKFAADAQCQRRFSSQAQKENDSSATPGRGGAATQQEAGMKWRRLTWASLFGLCSLAVGSTATANTVTQNVSWTIDRAGTTAKYRVDGLRRLDLRRLSRLDLERGAKRAAPWVDGEYLSQLWNADIEVIRRAKSGAVASDIYNNKIVAERSHMQTTEHARRHLRDVRQRRPAGAQQLRGPERHLQLRRRSTRR